MLDFLKYVICPITSMQCGFTEYNIIWHSASLNTILAQCYYAVSREPTVGSLGHSLDSRLSAILATLIWVYI